jgi:predicted nucleic acid-binding protein
VIVVDASVLAPALAETATTVTRPCSVSRTCRCSIAYGQFRDNLSSYDASYVALAEALDAVLITADRRLAKAVGVLCGVDVLR